MNINFNLFIISMYTKFLIILLLIFIVFNSQKLKEKFSNAFQDTEIRAKLSHFGTNLDEKKPLLTLYFDRREPNCKYFYDYFSIHYGGKIKKNLYSGTLNDLLKLKKESEEILASSSLTDLERRNTENVITIVNEYIEEGNYIKDADDTYQKSKKFTGKSQAWNQFKAIYADADDENN